MEPNIYLHHYPASPFSEKIRLMLGYLGVAWQSVRIVYITWIFRVFGEYQMRSVGLSNLGVRWWLGVNLAYEVAVR